jgi:hypothetical protein
VVPAVGTAAQRKVSVKIDTFLDIGRACYSMITPGNEMLTEDVGEHLAAERYRSQPVSTMRRTKMRTPPSSPA